MLRECLNLLRPLKDPPINRRGNTESREGSVVGVRPKFTERGRGAESVVTVHFSPLSTWKVVYGSMKVYVVCNSYYC